jgi:hypothetical protein
MTNTSSVDHWIALLNHCTDFLRDNLTFVGWFDDADEVTELTSDHGFFRPGASPAQIEAAERRLGVALPASYRAFLSITNGWTYFGLVAGRLASAEELLIFEAAEPSWTHELRLMGLLEDEAFIPRSIVVGPRCEGTVICLDPSKRTEEGDYAAFRLNTHTGVESYPSLFDLLAEHLQSNEEYTHRQRAAGKVRF